MPEDPAPVVAVRRIHHIGLAVPDLPGALDFFAETFGLRPSHTERNDDQGVGEAMLPTGAGSAGSVIQLVAPLGPDTTVARFLARRGPGMHHLALEVADVQAAATALAGRGLRVMFDHPRTGTAGSRVNFVHPADAFGVLIELVEPPAGSQHLS